MSTCACQYGYEESDSYASVWREASVAHARKAHTCCECGDEIPPGSACCYAFCVADGEAMTYYRCVSCATLAELVANINEACPLWGGLRDSADLADVDWAAWQEKNRLLDDALVQP